MRMENLSGVVPKTFGTKPDVKCKIYTKSLNIKDCSAVEYFLLNIENCELKTFTNFQ
jgi:hypothetical protein